MYSYAKFTISLKYEKQLCPAQLTLYRQKTISTKRRTALTTQTGITHLGRPFEGTATLASGFS